MANNDSVEVQQEPANSRPADKPKKSAKKKVAAKKPAKQKAPGSGNEPGSRSKAKDFDGNTSIRHLASLLDYSEATIRKHITENGGPVESKSGGGRASVVNVGAWHKFFLSRALGEGNLLSDTKLAKQQEDLRKQKRENDIAEGKVVTIDEVEFFYQSLLVILSNRLDGIPGKAAAGDPVLRTRFLDEISHAKLAIFNSIVEFLRPYAGDQQADLATAEAGKLGMGSREETPAKGSRRARTVQPKKNAVGDRTVRGNKKASY